MQDAESKVAEGVESSDRGEFLDQTLEFWTPLSGRELTREDARQIRENLTGFFGLLRQWDDQAVAEPQAPESVDVKRAA